MPTRFFRAGVGTVIYNEDGNVAFFRRKQHPPGIWQFQQGGIDDGETPEQTLWRELLEEVGLTKESIATTHELESWLIYQELDGGDPTNRRIGQAHRWYFLKLKPSVVIDLTLATDQEFDEWKWVTFPEAIAATGSHKQAVYRTLYEFFVSHIQKTSR